MARITSTSSPDLAPHMSIPILEKAAEIMKSRLEDLTTTATQEGSQPLASIQKKFVSRAQCHLQVMLIGLGNFFYQVVIVWIDYF